MPEVTVNVEVYCACGEGLCRQTDSKRTRNRQEPCFIVQPCDTCLEKAKEKARNDGYEEGWDEGYENAMDAHKAHKEKV